MFILSRNIPDTVEGATNEKLFTFAACRTSLSSNSSIFLFHRNIYVFDSVCHFNYLFNQEKVTVFNENCANDFSNNFSNKRTEFPFSLIYISEDSKEFFIIILIF